MDVFLAYVIKEVLNHAHESLVGIRAAKILKNSHLQPALEVLTAAVRH